MGQPVVRQKDPHAGCTLTCGISMDVRVTNVRVNGDQPAAAAGPTICTMGPGAHGPGDPHVIFKPIGPAIAVGQPTGCGGAESAGSPNVVLHGNAQASSWAQQLFDGLADAADATKDFIGRLIDETARLNSTGKPDPWAEGAAKLGAGTGFLLGAIAGGTVGGAGGTLVAPGVGTFAGAATVGAEQAGAGAVAGTGIGYVLGVEAHALYNMMSASNAGRSGKPNPKATQPYRDNPSQLEGRPPAEIEQELDQTLVKDGNWIKSASRDGNGTRYIDGKGGTVIINKGYPGGLKGGGGDLVHEGPYIKIQPGGIRVPLQGNPALGP